ncbi:MltA domain-containing protein [Rhodoplanes sp. TEM]|uniref:peptidoglycan lytic exotransglycosylase n=1 Tax=Rhodoplanes tepidamans TaxID=200616 RepID=A0ABT5J4H3_RHOTP|nr:MULTISPECIES: MltA domain-containing protein [Rhodoplanes]MDC7784234.1 MltA domain-containing protein [Rhodoplanes tepidamans]MDC7983626.1 MltA domain-containing protein [Rhodoplanes sp. TEM]MDQ0353633.1 membrane-bound lytic murein transglycosylase A [Rhodoplanes tepidamans]
MHAVRPRRLRLVLACAIGLSAAGLASVSSPAEAARRGDDPPLPRHRPALATETPLVVEDAQLEPVDFADLDGWADDDHAAAFAAFRTSCRPLVRGDPKADPRPMRRALVAPCRRALALRGQHGPAAARHFFEHNFRPLRISRIAEPAGFLTGYYEPIVDGSRFPTQVFKVPMYRRPPDLVAPGAKPGQPFPNRGQALRLLADGSTVPYHDRAEIEDGALDGRRLEICWLKDPADLLTIQIQGSARVRLEDGTLLRVNYDGHNGFSYTPVGRVLIERGHIPREEMSMARIRDWMRENPVEANEVRRQNRSFVFFRITGLDVDDEPVGAQGVTLAAGRSIAVDRVLHVYGTPFFIAAELPITGLRTTDAFRRTMIAQDTGSAIVGPARADLYFGAGDEAGRVAGRIRQAGRFTLLVPREIDPVAVGATMPLPLLRPPPLPPEKPAVKRRPARGEPRGPRRPHGR